MSLLTNLLGYWKLEESSGDRSSVVNGHTLTQNGTVSRGTGKKDFGAGSFSTSNFLSSTNSVFNLTGSYTFSGWVKFTDNGSTQTVFAIRTASGNILLRLTASSVLSGTYGYYLSYALNTGFTGSVNLGTTFTPSSDFLHFTVFYDSSTDTIGFSINGTTASVSPANAVFSSYNNFRLGMAGVDPWNSIIDEFAVWDRALSSTEREELRNNGSGSFYPFSHVVTDTLTFSDTHLKDVSQQLSDAVTFSDQLNRVFEETPIDAVSFTDSNATEQWHGRTVTDSFATTDSVATEQWHGRSLSDNLLFGENIVSGIPHERSISDTITFDDTPDYPWELLLEDETFILQEDGFKIQLEFRQHNFFSENAGTETIAFSDVIDYVLNGITYSRTITDTFVVTDVNSHQHKYDSYSDTITFTDDHHCSISIGVVTDNIVFTDSHVKNIFPFDVTDNFTLTDVIDRNDIFNESVADVLIFAQLLESSHKDDGCTDEILFTDSVTYQYPYYLSLSDDFALTETILPQPSIRDSVTDNLIFSDVFASNVSILDLSDTITFSDSNEGRASIWVPELIDDLLFTDSHSDIYTLQLLDTLTLTDASRPNIQIGEVESDILFLDSNVQSGSIYKSLEDHLIFSQVLESKESEYSRAVVDCLCFDDKALNPKYGDVTDSISFTDSAERVFWESIVDTIIFSQSNAIEGIDFASYHCAELNVESIEDVVVEDQNLTILETPIVRAPIVLAIPQPVQGVVEVRDCAGDIMLLYQRITDTISFEQSLVPFGDKIIALTDNLVLADYVVGFELNLRT